MDILIEDLSIALVDNFNDFITERCDTEGCSSIIIECDRFNISKFTDYLVIQLKKGQKISIVNLSLTVFRKIILI